MALSSSSNFLYNSSCLFLTVCEFIVIGNFATIIWFPWDIYLVLFLIYLTLFASLLLISYFLNIGESCHNLYDTDFVLIYQSCYLTLFFSGLLLLLFFVYFLQYSFYSFFRVLLLYHLRKEYLILIWPFLLIHIVHLFDFRYYLRLEVRVNVIRIGNLNLPFGINFFSTILLW